MNGSGPGWADRLQWTIKRHPERPAVVDASGSGAVLTYGDLAVMADRLAQGLSRMGVGEGSVIAYQLPNWWEFTVLTLALWRIDALPAPMLPGLGEREMERLLALARASLWVIPRHFRGRDWAEQARTVGERLPSLKHVVAVNHSSTDVSLRAFGSLLAAPEGPELKSEWGHENLPAQLLFTSGTTGEPKGVVHTHGSLARALDRHRERFGLRESDVIFVPSPVAHQTGFLYGMQLALYLGATALYLDHWEPYAAAAAIRRYGVTFVQAALPFLFDLGRLPDPPTVPLFVATGSSIPGALLHDIGPRLGGRIVKAWGSTETGLATAGRLEDAAALGWARDGCAMPGASVRVCDAENQPVPAGVVGKLWVRTDSMFATYWNHPDWHRMAMDDDNFFATGDLATQDERGYVAITGREKDEINRGGEKIPVAEIEELLYQHPDIAEVAVVAMPDARLGERACAVVVPENYLNPPALTEVTKFLAARHVAKMYWPERIEVVAELPRTASGKVQKFKLRQWVADRIEQPFASSPAFVEP